MLTNKLLAKKVYPITLQKHTLKISSYFQADKVIKQYILLDDLYERSFKSKLFWNTENIIFLIDFPLY